jgi:hypothetical protein
MDIATGTIIILLVSGVSVLLLYKFISQRYPPVKIRVYDRGLAQLITYRLWGYTIVKNQLFKLLLNEPEMTGDIRELEYDVEAGITGKERIYRGYRHHDYLFGLYQIKKTIVPMKVRVQVPVSKKYPDGIKEEMQEQEQEQMVALPLDKNPPMLQGVVTEDGKYIKATLAKDGLIFPFRMVMANDGLLRANDLSEQEVSKGKGICVRFIDSQKSTKAYLQASNPLMTVIYTTLPVLLIVVALGVTLYLIMQGVSDNILEISKLQAETIQKLAEIRGN